MNTRNFTVAAALLLAQATAPQAQAADFAVDFSWEGTAACGDPESPPFTLSNVPAGTMTLAFEMKDLDVLYFRHGGGTVPYRGQKNIERGAFTYKGPCPPQGQHSYQWTVEAQDGSGKILATATVMKKFPP
jgi:phosphatidylethanolamine-binding protein (PEBP) family uncharacterized protein